MNKILECILFCFCFFHIFNLPSREVGESFDERISYLEETIDDVTSKNETLQKTVLETTSAYPGLTKKNWIFNWDILYLHAKVGGTSFAFLNQRPSIDLPVQGFSKRIDFDWNFGFRAGLGRHFEHDKWSTFLNFTYFKASNSSELRGSSISYVTPLRGPFSHSVLQAKSIFDLKFYNLDLDLYRHYFISHGVSLKPSIGLKNTWLDLSQVTRYNEGAYLNNNTAQTIDSSDLWGMGPKAGFESTWYLNKGFNIFGSLSASLVYGYFQIKEDSSVTPTTNYNFIIKDKFHRFVPNVQFFLGLGYGSYIKEERYFVNLTMGYECQYYWRANQMVNLQRFNDSYRYENLSEDVSFHGAVLKLHVVF